MKSSQKDLNMNIIVEAKTQYTKQLMNILKPIVFDVLKTEYNKAYSNTENKKEVLYNFQTNLKEIQRWNSDLIKQETSKLLEKCSYFNDVITAVFVSNIRILTSVKVDKNKKKMKITIPSNETFIHKVYVNAAKSIFNNPSLFKPTKYGENTNEVHQIIEMSIDDAITELLPIQNILETYLGGDMIDSDDEEEEYVEEHSDYDDEPLPTQKEEREHEEEMLESIQPETQDELVSSPDEASVNQNKVADFFENPNLDDIKKVPINGGKGEEKAVKQQPDSEKRKESFFDDVDD